MLDRAAPEPDEDDAALSWAGDEERGRDALWRPKRPGGQSRLDEEADDDADSGSRPTSPLLLISYGILGGIYGIFSIGWISSVLRSTTTLGSLPAEILYQFGEFLAIALPPLWFAAVLWLVERPSRRLVWLLIGIPVALPWPWVLGS